ncbi:MAG: ABC transporter ATP-binding protein/permease [Pseudomonas sp.]
MSDPTPSPTPNPARPSFFGLIQPFWLSEQKWKALTLFGIGQLISFGHVYLLVQINRLEGTVMDAMIGRSWNTLWPALAAMAGVGLTLTLALTFKTVLSDLLELQWRSWMTHRYLEAWTHRDAYYAIEREGRVDNADQRIAQDIAQFVEITLRHATTIVYVITNTITFTVLLWQLGGTLSFNAFGREISIPGYQVYLAYLYVISVLLVTHFFGRQLTRLFNRRQGMEADFRFLGMQLRENAEQVAFYSGGQRERRRLEGSFERVRSNTAGIILRTFKMTVIRDSYTRLLSPLPTLASLPRYLAGEITLGHLTRTVDAFGRVRTTLSWFYQAYIGFAEWVAISNRLRDLSAALAEQRGEHDQLGVARHAQAPIQASALHLRAPDGTSLAQVAPLRIAPGERWLLRGPSGSGKSTLLRALAGLWPHGEGQVTLPQEAVLMFLPQRSYIPAGTLKAGLCYPAGPEAFSDADCRQALRACHLASYIDALDSEERWQKRLSGGEQQRLAVARALLHKPDFLFLDEATSALDPPTEQALYAALRDHLPGSALVSVAHRGELDAFHDRVFELEAAQADAGEPPRP